MTVVLSSGEPEAHALGSGACETLPYKILFEQLGETIIDAKYVEKALIEKHRNACNLKRARTVACERQGGVDSLPKQLWFAAYD